ncbi:M28 family peptidase [Ampullimonas aquatilis]|uniref:M28 family peptidase n=1 Tax=Ampullimonas aquatilis TaxID=1341549 RepID=UPI003C71F9D8
MVNVRTVNLKVRLLNAWVLTLLVVMLVFAAIGWMTSMPGQLYSGVRSSPDANTIEMAAQLQRHVLAVARVPHHAQEMVALQQVQAYLTDSLTAMGYQVRPEAVPGGQGPVYNLIAELPATRPSADKPTWLVIGAHYDSVPTSPGADDNASGVAALLVLAESLRHQAKATKIGVRFELYVNEEDPYFKTPTMGSLVRAKNSTVAGDQLLGMLSLEAIGCFSDAPDSQDLPWPFSLLYPDTGNYIGLVGKLQARDWVRQITGLLRSHALLPIHGGVAPGLFEEVDWSDHWSYSEQGVPALMITDTALNRNHDYHKMSDTPEKLDYIRLALLVQALQATVYDLTDAVTDSATDSSSGTATLPNGQSAEQFKPVSATALSPTR